jgi:hypothetical protein
MTTHCILNEDIRFNIFKFLDNKDDFLNVCFIDKLSYEICSAKFFWETVYNLNGRYFDEGLSLQNPVNWIIYFVASEKCTIYAKNILNRLKTDTLHVGYDNYGYDRFDINGDGLEVPINSINDNEIFNGIDNVDINDAKTALIEDFKIRNWDSNNWNNKQILTNTLGRLEIMESNNYNGYNRFEFQDIAKKPFIVIENRTDGISVGFLHYSGSINNITSICYDLSKEMAQKLLYNMAIRGLFLHTYTGYVIGLQ